MSLNQELNGIELSFKEKPEQSIINLLKEVGYRWHNVKKLWYAKQNEKTLKAAKELSDNITELKTEAEQKTIKNNMFPLWDRIQYQEGDTDTSKYNYKFVGSRYNHLSVKETAQEIRKHLKTQFPEVKFSVTSDYNSINVYIKSSPYEFKFINDFTMSPQEIRHQYEEKYPEIKAIERYINQYVKSYNYNDSDSMTDYFDVGFYETVGIESDYIQTEQTETIKTDIINFRESKIAQEKAEEEKQESEYRQREIEQKEAEKQRKIRAAEEQKEIEFIYQNVGVFDLKEDEQSYITNCKFAHLNKNATLQEYYDEVKTGEYNTNTVKITRRIIFSSEKALNYFNNLLLNDFDFLTNSGGSYTDDPRINSMTDYSHMTQEEKESVVWNLSGIAVYYDSKLQYVIDTQGYNYARYIGLTDNVEIKKELEPIEVIDKELLKELKKTSGAIEDISAGIISDNLLMETWKTDNKNKYYKLMQVAFKEKNIKLSREIIQQITIEDLKIAMYEMLTYSEEIQTQFEEVNLTEGEKLTLF
jgi:hypothetical protein